MSDGVNSLHCKFHIKYDILDFRLAPHATRIWCIIGFVCLYSLYIIKGVLDVDDGLQELYRLYINSPLGNVVVRSLYKKDGDERRERRRRRQRRETSFPENRSRFQILSVAKVSALSVFSHMSLLICRL